MTLAHHDYYNVSEIVLTYKSKIKAMERPQITRSEDSYAVFMQTWDDDKIDFVEEAKLMLLNRANRVLGICALSSGGGSGTVVDTRLVFAAALKANASSIILAHNHPSENLTPSFADKELTSKLILAGDLLTIKLLDHIIVGRRGYYSFSDEQCYQMPETKILGFPLPISP